MHFFVFFSDLILQNVFLSPCKKRDDENCCVCVWEGREMEAKVSKKYRREKKRNKAKASGREHEHKGSGAEGRGEKIQRIKAKIFRFCVL